LSWPGKRRLVATPDIVRALLSMEKFSSVFPTSWWTERVAL
jgi:hypothetical protein